MKKIPNSRRKLDAELARCCERGQSVQLVRTSMADAIIGQLLDGGVVKGGCALKFRFGYTKTRFTTDLDTARNQDINGFIDKLGLALNTGWNGFTGTIVERNAARPEGIPPSYIMRPFDIKLAYNGKSWMTVPLEVGHDEIGDTSEPDYFISDEMVALFTKLGFPAPKPIPIMPLHHQIAQKLHALTGLNSVRAHDLVDLQLLMKHGDVDFRKTKAVCERLFLSRKMQTWPPSIVKGENWEGLYNHAKEDLPVLQTIDEAIVWGNKLIKRITEA